MYREIKKKILILKNRKPFNPETADYIAEMNRLDWISSCLKLSGTPVSREGVQKIMKGELLVDVSLKTHLLIHRYVDMIRHIESMLEMGTELSEKELIELYRMLFNPEPETEPDGTVTFYRRSNPVLVEWEYNPPYFDDVREQMGLIFHWAAQERVGINPDMNPMLRAAVLHNKIAEIYPFGEESAVMARAAMLYELMSAGLPPVRLDMSEQEYNCAVVLYLRKEDSTPLYEVLEKSVYNQLELMAQLTSIR